MACVCLYVVGMYCDLFFLVPGCCRSLGTPGRMVALGPQHLVAGETRQGCAVPRDQM